MLKQGAASGRIWAQVYRSDSVISIFGCRYQSQGHSNVNANINGITHPRTATTHWPVSCANANLYVSPRRPFSHASRSGHAQAAQASLPEAASTTTTSRVHANVKDPRAQGQDQGQQSSQSVPSEQMSDLDRYPAIQQLRKVNFREGKEPYQIYAGSLTQQFRRLKLFSMLTSATGLSVQPVIFQSLYQSGMAVAILGIAPVFLFTYVTPIFIHFLSKRYVTEMFYDPATDTYTGVTRNFFLQRKEFVFKLTDVTVPDVPGMLTTFLLKRKDAPGKTRPIFMMDTDFKYLEHYGRLMKFDEPIDLRLGEPESHSRNK